MELITTQSPETTLNQLVSDFHASDQSVALAALRYDFTQYYLPDTPPVALLAVVAITPWDICVGIVQHAPALAQQLADLPARADANVADYDNGDIESVESWVREQGAPWLSLTAPLTLEPVAIAKPWGQEIWYTGIEERGQSRVGDGEHSLPLPWLLSLCPERLLGRPPEKIILLKILDPLPEPVFGDLYFEMHQEKREVYVVTHVDATAWPSGEGGIRFGFDQAQRRQAGSDQAFKDQYLQAVQAYRAVRCDIDARLDAFRRQADIPLNAPVSAETLRDWLAQLPAELSKKEAALRQAMEAFIHVEPLQVGDVIQVPTRTPHSLLHGVRTIEFQTPVYERQILSFAQKVLTQDHWDTETALATVNLEAPERPSLPLVAEGGGVRVEAVVAFDDFAVERLTLTADTQVDIPLDDYRLVMTVQGAPWVNEVPLAPEQACLLSADCEQLVIENRGAQQAIVLLAKPRD